MFNRNVYKYDDMKRREHMAVRRTVGWYLFTHQLLEVTGKDAVPFLDKVFTGDIANLKVGRDRYTLMLDEQAQIIGDVIIMHIDEGRYWISTLFLTKLTAWLDAHKEGFDVAYENVTARYHMYAVQGPKSRELVDAIAQDRVDNLKFFGIMDTVIDGVPVKINRAGFTGEEFGYEIYFAADQIGKIEAQLKEKGAPLGAVEVTEFQIMAWTLPTEAGYYYMRDLMHTDPIEVGLEYAIDWDKDFIGKSALQSIKDAGPAREMVGFTMDEDDARVNAKDLGGPGTRVMLDGHEIGRVSKFNYSFLNEKNVGYLLVRKGTVKKGDHVAINDYDAIVTEKKFI